MAGDLLERLAEYVRTHHDGEQQTIELLAAFDALRQRAREDRLRELAMELMGNYPLVAVVRALDNAAPGFAAKQFDPATVRVPRDVERDAARYRLLQKMTPYAFGKIQRAATADAGDVLYFLKEKFDAAVDVMLSAAEAGR